MSKEELFDLCTLIAMHALIAVMPNDSRDLIMAEARQFAFTFLEMKDYAEKNDPRS